MLDNQVKQGVQVFPVLAQVINAPAITARGIHDGEIKLVFISIERDEEIKDLINHLIGAGIAAINLVDDDDRPQALFQRLAQHELGLRHRAFGGIGQENHAIRHVEDTFNLTPEISVARGVDNVDPHIPPLD